MQRIGMTLGLVFVSSMLASVSAAEDDMAKKQPNHPNARAELAGDVERQRGEAAQASQPPAVVEVSVERPFRAELATPPTASLDARPIGDAALTSSAPREGADGVTTTKPALEVPPPTPTPQATPTGTTVPPRCEEAIDELVVRTVEGKRQLWRAGLLFNRQERRVLTRELDEARLARIIDEQQLEVKAVLPDGTLALVEKDTRARLRRT